MKMGAEEALKSLEDLYYKSRRRMAVGSKKYKGKPFDPLKEVEEEVCDCFNYLAMFLAQLKRRQKK